MQKWEYLVEVCFWVKTTDPERKGVGGFFSATIGVWEWNGNQGDRTKTIEERLNKLGGEGWELVSESVESFGHHGKAQYSGITDSHANGHRFVFKRPLP